MQLFLQFYLRDNYYFPDRYLNIEFELLRRDIDRLSGLFGRLDVTIEKLTEVSNNVSRMLAVHENRISQQEELLKNVVKIGVFINKYDEEEGGGYPPSWVVVIFEDVL